MNEPLRLVSQPVASDPLGQARDFEDLVEAEHPGLYGALCLITRDRFEAEDVMQEAFLKVWERWDRVRGLQDPTGYLYRTALNLYRKRLRRASLVIRRAVRLAPPRDELAEVEARDAVARALAELTPRQRTSVVLVDLIDLSSEDAGRVMGIKAATVRVLVSQGRAARRIRKGTGSSDTTSRSLSKASTRSSHRKKAQR
jgi:RNA polymerase sigma-70 factor (ECF subfamily)